MDEDGYSSSGSETEEPPHTAILIIGRSASGKTSLIRNILPQYSRYNKPIYLLNDRSQSKRYAHISWAQAETVSNAVVICEDIIQATIQQHRILQNLLSYKIHHDKVSPFIGKTRLAMV